MIIEILEEELVCLTTGFEELHVLSEADLGADQMRMCTILIFLDPVDDGMCLFNPAAHDRDERPILSF
jgi:hypothetical protein